MKTIPLHQLAAYLPYETKVTFMYKRKQVIGTMDSVYSDGTITCGDTINASPNKFKLMLVPFTAENIKDTYSLDIWNFKNKIIDLKHVPYYAICELLRKHIDIFNLIPQGLAVEKGGV